MEGIEVLVERLRALSRIEDPEVVREELRDERPEDIAEAAQRLQVEEGLAVLRRLEHDVAAVILTELPTSTARAYVRHLPDETIAHYLDVMPKDDALDLREEVGEERFDALLEVIPREDADEIRRLMAYPEGSTGRLLTERFFEVTPGMTMAEVLADVRRASPGKYETVNDIYVLDERRHLLGVISLRRAIREPPEARAGDVMRTEVVVAEATEPAEDAARRMSRYGFYALPVIDRRGRMVGLFAGDDAQAVLREAETEDVLKLGAVSGDADSYVALGPVQLCRRRLPWLLALFVAETFTGSVMRHYGEGSETLALAPLTFFIPLLIGAGGNAGSQVTTTITRSLALGEVTSRDWLMVMRRELLTAVMIGSILGALGFARAFLVWPLGWDSGLPLSLVVAIALPCIIVWAATVGSMLPLAAKRLGIDPAVMSAPFITTFVDATGLVIYFEIALRILGHS
jgi:magnesium transporter